jgi:O-antigen/teichoic acid export membrane protein
MTAEESAPISRGELQRRAVAGSLWTGLHALLAAPTAFTANAIVARLLGPTDYGRLAFLTLMLALAAQLTHLGFSSGITQYGAQAEAVGDTASAERLLSRSLGFHVLVQLPLLAAAAVVLGRGESLPVLLTLLAGIVLSAGLSSTALSLTIENKSAGAAKIAMLSNLLVQTAVAATAALEGSPAGVWAVRSLAASALLPLNFVLLSRARRRAVLRLALPRGLPAGFWRFCLFSWVGGLVTTLVFSRSELLLLSALSTPAAVGLFALAYGVCVQITAPVDAILGPLYPAVAGLLSSHPDAARSALLRSVRLAALVGGAVTASVLPTLYFALPLIYGQRFAAAAPLLLLLGVASCLQSVLNPVAAFTQGRGRTDLLLFASLVALVADVALALALIPPYGVWGAAIANAAGFVVFFAALLRRELRDQQLAWGVIASTTAAFPLAVLVGAAVVALAGLLPGALRRLCGAAAVNPDRVAFGRRRRDHDRTARAGARSRRTAAPSADHGLARTVLQRIGVSSEVLIYKPRPIQLVGAAPAGYGRRRIAQLGADRGGELHRVRRVGSATTAAGRLGESAAQGVDEPAPGRECLDGDDPERLDAARDDRHSGSGQ